MKLFNLSVIFTAFLITSCDSPDDQSAEVAALKNRLEDAEAKAQWESDDFLEKVEKLEEENRKALSESREFKSLLKTRTNELENLSGQFESYRGKASEVIEGYIARIQKNGIGEKLPVFKVGDEILRDVEITDITLSEIRARHRSGVVVFNQKTAPQAWAKKYFVTTPKDGFAKKTPAIAANDSRPKETEAEASPSPANANFNPKKAVVIIEGDTSSGTGFFVRSSRSTYLYTAAHVLSGNKSLTIKTIDGKEFKRFGPVEIADGADIARMRVLTRVPFSLSLPTKGEIKNKVEIRAIGNSGGGSVLTDAEGIVSGVGAESFEISAEVIQGNSGGPIVREGSTTVLGLVTHGLQARTDVWAEETRYRNVRRFGARMDRRHQWVKMPLSTFLAEYEKVEDFHKVTRLLYALSALSPGPNGLRLSTYVNGNVTALQIFSENKKMSAVKSLIKMNTELGSKKIKPDPSTIRKRFAGYYRGIINGSSVQITSLKSLSPFHQKLAKASMDDRKKAHAAVVKKLRSLSK